MGEQMGIALANKVIRIFLNDFNLIVWLISIIIVIFIPKISLPPNNDVITLFIAILTVFLLNATSSLISFTYLIVMKGDDNIYSVHPDLGRLSYSDITNKLNKMTLDLSKLSDELKIKTNKYGTEDNIPKEERNELYDKIKKIKTSQPEVLEDVRIYNNALILRSGEYFFLNTIFLIVGFIFFVLYALFYYLQPNETLIIDLMYRISALFPLAAFIIFIRGVINIFRVFGHISFLRQI